METNLVPMQNSINIAAPQVEGSTRKFLAEIIVDDDLNRIKPGCFNILAAPRGWGKTTFMFDQRILNFSRDRKHIIYLVHNKAMRANIRMRYPQETIEFIDADADGWFTHRKKTMWSAE